MPSEEGVAVFFRIDLIGFEVSILVPLPANLSTSKGLSGGRGLLTMF